MDNIVPIVFHDDDDPWSNSSPDHSIRCAYYPVQWWPDFIVDGVEQHIWPVGGMVAAYDSRIVVDSPIMFDFSAIIAGNTINVEVDVTTADVALTGNNKLRIALCNYELHDFWTGSNGQSDFEYDMLTMAPDANGIDCEVAANSTETFTATFDWPVVLNDETMADDNVRVVIWVQDDDSKEVHNADWMEPVGCNVGLDLDRETALIAASEVATFNLDVTNYANFDDVFEIDVAHDLPANWDLTYTTPDGNQTGNYNQNVTAGSEFTSAISITTDDVVGASASVTFTVTSQTMEMSQEVTVYVMTNGDILLVNDDMDTELPSYYVTSLDNIGLLEESSYAVWHQGYYNLNLADLENTMPEIIIWVGGGTGHIPADDLAGLENYLSMGGNLWMTGSNLPADLADTDLIDMMGASYQDYFNGESVFGDEDDPYFANIEVDIQGGDGANNRELPTAVRAEGGSVCLKYSLVRRAAVCYDTDNYNTLLMGFPFEAIADQAGRDAVMSAATGFLLEINDAPDNSGIFVPQEFALEQNYPNPFNPTTKIGFNLSKPGMVKLSVFDIQGREVAVLIDESLQNGEHSITFDAEDLPSGVYFARLVQDSKVATRKMLLVK